MMDPRLWTVDYIWQMGSYDILFDERLRYDFCCKLQRGVIKYAYKRANYI